MIIKPIFAVKREDPIRIELDREGPDIDLVALRNQGLGVIRKAAIFCSIGSRAGFDSNGPDSFFGDGSKYQFPQGPDESNALVDSSLEFKAWVVENCFRELEAGFSLFLDEWASIYNSIAEQFFRQPVMPIDVKKFSSDTNVSRKFSALGKFVELRPGASDILSSISFARNALTHNAGIVRSPRDCNHDNGSALYLKWWAAAIVGTSVSHKEIFFRRDVDTSFFPEGEKVDLQSMRYCYGKIFPAGERIVLDAQDLVEILSTIETIVDSLSDDITRIILPYVE